MKIRRWRKVIRREVFAMWFCLRRPEAPCRLKVALGCVALLYLMSVVLTDGYALGWDMIPDWVPVLGLFDDVILFPVAIWLFLHYVPADLRRTCRKQAMRRLVRARWAKPPQSKRAHGQGSATGIAPAGPANRTPPDGLPAARRPPVEW